MSERLAHFMDFSKGHAGNVDKRAVADGYWHGINVQTYPDGAVGPRSDPQDLAPTGLSTDTVWQIGYIDRQVVDEEYVWVHQGTKVGRILVYDAGNVQTAQAWTEAAGVDFDAEPEDGLCDYVDTSPGVTYIALRADNVYKYTHADNTLAKIDPSYGGSCIEVYREFLVTAGGSTNPNRVRFSAAGDFEDWSDAANFFDLVSPGGGPTITAMRAVRDALLCWTDMGQLFVITGRLGSNQVVRQFMPGDQVSGPAFARAVARSREGSAWWMRRDAMSDVFWQAESSLGLYRAGYTPVVYTGGQRLERNDWSGFLTDFEDSNPRTSQYQAFSGRRERSVGFIGRGADAVLLRDGAGSFHVLPFEGGEIVSCSGERGDVFLATQYDPDTTDGPFLYGWWWEQDRPAFERSSGLPVPMDVPTINSAIPAFWNWFATPLVRAKDGGFLRVSRVDVIFTSYRAQSGLGHSNNTFEVAVQQFGAIDSAEKNLGRGDYNIDDDTNEMVTGGVTIGCTEAFDEAPDADYNVDRRVSFYPLDAAVRPAPMARVLVRHMRGVAIREVIVYGATEPEPRG